MLLDIQRQLVIHLFNIFKMSFDYVNNISAIVAAVLSSAFTIVILPTILDRYNIGNKLNIYLSQISNKLFYAQNKKKAKIIVKNNINKNCAFRIPGRYGIGGINTILEEIARTDDIDKIKYLKSASKDLIKSKTVQEKLVREIISGENKTIQKAALELFLMLDNGARLTVLGGLTHNIISNDNDMAINSSRLLGEMNFDSANIVLNGALLPIVSNAAVQKIAIESIIKNLTYQDLNKVINKLIASMDESTISSIEVLEFICKKIIDHVLDNGLDFNKLNTLFNRAVDNNIYEMRQKIRETISQILDMHSYDEDYYKVICSSINNRLLEQLSFIVEFYEDINRNLKTDSEFRSTLSAFIGADNECIDTIKEKILSR